MTNNNTKVSDYKDIFMSYASCIERDGFNNLLAWLTDPVKSDFFTAPASTKYHSNIEGGLCMHTVHVYERLERKLPDLRAYYPDLTEAQLIEKIAIVALLHDLCKVNFYVASTRNVKNEETGKWESATRS